MISKDYSYVNAPNGYRLLREGEEIKKTDIYYADIEKISHYNIDAWRECKIGVGKKYSKKSFLPVARRV